ncbi:hypothetical protein [Hyalangium versicolor]|uniref:hypothetical protein n=1 Tax=Hyalangium versicolor TaxID=2861190 RepID=UPI001CCB98C8|nr:hypothetical protein [Hyalangium versicolor]
MKHLDAHTLRALAAREPEAVTHFREHLASPCDTCEEFLAQHPDTDLLDGQVDLFLLSLAPAREVVRDDVGWMRLKKRLRTSNPVGRWVGVATALAACVLGAVLVPRMLAPPGNPQWTGVKGSSRITLELVAAARGADGRLRRLDPGEAVSPEDVLLLRYHSTEAGSALLFQQVGSAAPELLGNFLLEAGTHDLEGPQGLTGVSLTGEKGPVSLWLVASPAGEELSEEGVKATLKGGTARVDNPLSTARFDVFVKNSENQR